MPSLPDLIVLAVIMICGVICVAITYRAHHTSASLLEQHKAAAARHAAFGTADPTQPLTPAPRRRRRAPWVIAALALTAGAVYLWQTGASAATTAAAHPVLGTATRAPAHTNASGWAVLIVLIVIVAGFIFKPWRRGGKAGK